MLLNEIPEPRLTAELVHSLSDLVAGGVTQAGEEGKELFANGRLGVLSEDDRVDVSGVDLIERRLLDRLGERRGEGTRLTGSLWVINRLAIV